MSHPFCLWSSSLSNSESCSLSSVYASSSSGMVGWRVTTEDGVVDILKSLPSSFFDEELDKYALVELSDYIADKMQNLIFGT